MGAIGSRMFSSGGGGTSGGRTTRSAADSTERETSSLISSAGTMVGGLVASELASSSVRALHQDSVNRIRYKKECQRALERGQPMPPPPKTSFLDLVGQQIGDILKQKTMDDTTNNDQRTHDFHSFPNNYTNTNERNYANNTNNGKEQYDWQEDLYELVRKMAKKSAKSLFTDARVQKQ